MDVTIPCPCEGSPHDEDTVTLRDKMDSHRALIITKAVGFVESDDERVRPAEVLATLSEFYVLLGIQSWTLRDGSKPLPLTEDNVRRKVLDNVDAAMVVVEAADELYNKAILLPLMARASRSSQPSPTETPTSPTPDGGQAKRPRPSRRSSITTIPTGAIETTSASLDGVSSSSQSSESAA